MCYHPGMRTNPRFALIAALLLGAVAPALAQAPPSSAQQKADNDRIIDNAVRSTQRDISQLQNQLEAQHLESQQRFQQQPVTPQFPPTPPGFIPMPENNPPPVPKL